LLNGGLRRPPARWRERHHIRCALALLKGLWRWGFALAALAQQCQAAKCPSEVSRTARRGAASLRQPLVPAGVAAGHHEAQQDRKHGNADVVDADLRQVPRHAEAGARHHHEEVEGKVDLQPDRADEDALAQEVALDVAEMQREQTGGRECIGHEHHGTELCIVPVHEPVTAGKDHGRAEIQHPDEDTVRNDTDHMAHGAPGME